LEYDGGIPEGELLGNLENSNNSQFDWPDCSKE
jgi:hypothetical protein